MRGNRTIKVSASELDAFHSPNMLPLAKMGINIDVDYRAIHRYLQGILNEIDEIKGQLISKGLFGVIVSTKKSTKFF